MKYLPNSMIQLHIFNALCNETQVAKSKIRWGL